MNGLVTTVGFVAVTAVFVALHLRKTGGSGGAADSRPCPRCGTTLSVDAQWCPKCKAPPQAFDLVSAKIVTEEKKAEPGAAMHALVRADVCVGCGTCVPVCPEPGAIQIVNKVARVDADLCKGHGHCAAACPVNGIVITSGAAVQVVEVPDLSPRFESNSVPGLFVAGELGGRGLIKNAVNEGRLAMEGIAESLQGDPFKGDVSDGVHDVIVVGSGPSGISAGLEAMHQGLRYLILEQGTLADTISKYPRKKLLFAEPLRVPVYGDLWVTDATKESLLAVWQTVIEKTGLRIQSHTRVESVVKEGPIFMVRCGERTFRTRRVLLCMGRRGTPRRLGVPGEELDKVLYDIVEMEAFEGQRMLVVGGGDSAVESALGLANQPGTTVTLSYRGSEFGRVKERNREKIDAAVDAGKVELLLGSQVKEIRRDVVVLEHEGTLRLLPNDGVVVRIGGEAPYPFLERIGVRIVKKELAIEEPSDSRSGAHA
ncbi:MAG: NAD(P)-binding domain-containing protein [Candidatus Eisenbacteria bacterium]|uniref:NAD(P)-binding domain-containing protein n=1 Tax=Eiseniibacteriota bacterium TaxID=2212470 RepID=A0A933SBW3_UNCEI|nr:NAD(P)-binding domain-containing protein [Candidatus Eisenbacteria bacterium]